jgi:Protein of unknown function (DUF2569)
MSYRDDLRGVGGWLAFLVISLVALGPLRTLVSTYLEMSATEQANPLLANMAAWGTVKIISWVMTLLQIAMMIFAGVRLNSVFRRSTVRIAIGVLWVAGPVWNFLALLVIAVSLGVEVSRAGADVWMPIGQSAVYALVWTLYLLMSSRVRNTYFDDEEAEAGGSLAEVFE